MIIVILIVIILIGGIIPVIIRRHVPAKGVHGTIIERSHIVVGPRIIIVWAVSVVAVIVIRPGIIIIVVIRPVIIGIRVTWVIPLR